MTTEEILGSTPEELSKAMLLSGLHDYNNNDCSSPKFVRQIIEACRDWLLNMRYGEKPTEGTVAEIISHFWDVRIQATGATPGSFGESFANVAASAQTIDSIIASAMAVAGDNKPVVFDNPDGKVIFVIAGK